MIIARDQSALAEHTLPLASVPYTGQRHLPIEGKGQDDTLPNHKQPDFKPG